MVQEMAFEDISYLELWRPFVRRGKTICAISVDSIMRNISVKLFWIWTKVSGDVV